LFRRRSGIARVYCFVRAQTSSVFELNGIDVTSDDSDRTKNTHQLYGHVTQSAETEYDDCAIGMEQRQGAFNGMVRSQCRIG